MEEAVYNPGLLRAVCSEADGNQITREHYGNGSEGSDKWNTANQITITTLVARAHWHWDHASSGPSSPSGSLPLLI